MTATTDDYAPPNAASSDAVIGIRNRRAMTVLAIFFLSACDGPQSALSPAGRHSETLAGLFWVMLIGATIVWCLMIGLVIYVTKVNPRPMSRRGAQALVVGGGIVFPTLVVGALLVYGLSIMPDQRAIGSGTVLTLTGEQFWWRVEYLPEGAETPVVSANEVVLPAGSRSEIILKADKVIHSFWVPALGGKTDMIPGRINRMSLEPLEPGVYRGQCAEFCGDSHALMALNAVVLAPDAFEAWLEREALPASAPQSEMAERGLAVFLGEGCGGCHTVRGTPAAGRVGPDLTHVAGRTTLAAGVLPVTETALADWIRDPAAIKPGVEMPSFEYLSPRDLDALVVYLMGLT